MKKIFLFTIFAIGIVNISIGKDAYFKASSSVVNDMSLPNTSGFWYSDSNFANQLNVPQGSHAYYADLIEYAAFMEYNGSASAKISGSQWDGSTMKKPGGYLNVDTFTVNATNTVTKNASDSDYFIVIGGDATIKTKNAMTLNFGNSGANDYSAQKLLFWNGAKLQVGTDLIVNNTTLKKSDGTILKVGVQFAEGSSGGGACSMTVNGKFILANDIAENGEYAKADAYFGVGTVTIKKNVVLNGNMIDFYHKNSVASKGSQDVSSLQRYVGGIGVETGTVATDRGYTGNIQSTATGNVWINLTNTQAYEYAGSLTSVKDGSSSINLIMNGSTTGKQILRIKSTSDYWSAGVELSNSNIQTVTVKNGTLELGMTSQRKVEQLTMEGGKFSSTGLNVGDKIGSLNIDYFNWKDGSLVIDATSASSFDKFIVNDTFLKTDDVIGMAFEFTTTAEELKKFENNMMEFIFLTFASTNITNLEDFIITTQADVLATLSWIENGGVKTGISVQLEAIPEPATLAAIFGFMAIALAIYRRKK